MHHFRSLPADLHSNRRPGTSRPNPQDITRKPKTQPTTFASHRYLTPTQQGILLDKTIPVIYPHTRSPSTRSSSRRRALRRHRLHFFLLLVILGLLLLALPVTIVFLAQASYADRTIVPPLVAFLVITLFACLSTAGVGALYLRHRRGQLTRAGKLEREVEHWRKLGWEKGQEAERWCRLATEKGQEVQALQHICARMRSKSRGRRKCDESMSRAGSASVGHGIEKDEEQNMNERSVSRGRTGRGAAMKDLDVEKGIAELDGKEITVTRAILETDTTKGSVAKAKQAAFARLRSKVAEKPLPSLPANSQSSPLPPPPEVPAHPPRRASLGWQPRWNAVLAQYSKHQSHELAALTPLVQCSDSQTLTSSSQQAPPGRLQDTVLLPPPELILDDPDSPGVQTTVLDRYVVPEQYRQGLERREGSKRWRALHRKRELGRKLRQRRELEAELARHDRSDASGNDPAVGEARDQHESDRGWNRVLEMTVDDESSPASDDEEEEVVETGVARIVRAGNGGWGDAQSDENFEESHALEEDAVSLTESLRQKKRAESLKKVASWEDGTRVAAAAEPEEGAVGAIVDVKDSDGTARPQDGDSNLREGLDVGQLWNSMKDENWEIHERRRMFEKFLDTKTRQGESRSRTEPGEINGSGIPGNENMI
ncbi:hypothetical protein MMC11_002111 [Xylographa trunciseda]|nr:hypothetical protein [Xylographa trunciseda]